MSDLDGLAARVVALAHAMGVTIATAESCTAGCLATLLADAPGAGASFHGGIVTYSKANKVRSLGVPSGLIATHTAVSREVAEAMAKGLIARTPADMGIAITGVAGPEPDEDGNPVGLMHVAVALRDRDLRHRQHSFGAKERAELRAAAMTAALVLASECFADCK